MKLYRHIAAVFLLCTYCVVFLHTAIPHSHYESEEVETIAILNSSDTHSHVHHHHDTGHHEHDSEANWWGDFLDLLGDFGHSDLGEGHFEDFIHQDQHDFDFSTHDYNNMSLVAEFTYLKNTVSSKKKAEIIDLPPLLYEQYFHCSDPLRGPPSIA